MFIVGFFMLLSAVLMVLLARSNRINPVDVEQVTPTPAAAEEADAAVTAKDDVR